MGADLYLPSLAGQPDGYFRDSYGRALLWVYGLSWAHDVLPLTDEAGYLSVANARRFLRQLEDREADFERCLSLQVNGDADRQHAEQLKRFLTTAIGRNERILTSL